MSVSARSVSTDAGMRIHPSSPGFPEHTSKHTWTCLGSGPWDKWMSQASVSHSVCEDHPNFRYCLTGDDEKGSEGT